MTELLEKAFATVAKLEPSDQDTFAVWILAELESEERWAKAFADSENILAELANEALAEFRAGKTLELDPATL